MKIGLDLSVVQTPHRMRGIGATAINFVNNIPDDIKSKNTFVIFLYEKGQGDALKLLDLQNLHYEIRTINENIRKDYKLPSKLKRLNGPLNSYLALRSAKKGDSRISPNLLDGLDGYLQFDQMQPPPKKAGLKTAVILYDLIPYILESDYLWSYKTARKNGDSRKSSFRKALLRKQYIQQVKLVCKSADKLIAISGHTKKDFIKYLSVPEHKIKVIHLGINRSVSTPDLAYPGFEKYEENSWGYFKRPTDLQNKDFILFVGGADPRRKLIDLVAAYNNLRAQGNDISLVLAGDTMKGPKSIPVPEVQKYLLQSSYEDQIFYLGFIDDGQREWLYQNALAFVYPSVYEGFGLPILEAMQYGTPVITFNNSSIYEISGESALYAKNINEINEHILKLRSDSAYRSRIAEKGINQANKYDWEVTSISIINTVAS